MFQYLNFSILEITLYSDIRWNLDLNTCTDVDMSGVNGRAFCYFSNNLRGNNENKWVAHDRSSLSPPCTTHLAQHTTITVELVTYTDATWLVCREK